MIALVETGMLGPEGGIEGVGEKQVIVVSSHRGDIVCMGSAYDVGPRNRDRDVVCNASYAGVLPVRFIAEHRPRGAIGVDCGIGKDGAGIAGLWYLEALGILGAAADVHSVELGNGIDLYEAGTISRANEPARSVGVRIGMSVSDAAGLMLETDPVVGAAAEVTNRTVMHEEADGRAIVCTDSIAFGLPEDAERNVLCTAGHTGRSSVPYLRRVRPRGFICSDGGRGKNDAGTAGLGMVESDGLAGATVDAATARMGDALSTFHDGVISACNAVAAGRGVRVGQAARDAALLLLRGR